MSVAHHPNCRKSLTSSIGHPSHPSVEFVHASIKQGSYVRSQHHGIKWKFIVCEYQYAFIQLVGLPCGLYHPTALFLLMPSWGPWSPSSSSFIVSVVKGYVSITLCPGSFPCQSRPASVRPKMILRSMPCKSVMPITNENKSPTMLLSFLRNDAAHDSTPPLI